jgi:geranylgeranyl transferase type-1 subunit beta
VYCACAVAAMLGDFSGIDRPAAARFIRSCLSYDGAFAQAPELEAHGG